jgi:hypothetical protein
MSPTTARYGADFLQIGNCAFASKCDDDCSKYPPHEHHSSKRSLTGPDLHAWRIRRAWKAHWRYRTQRTSRRKKQAAWIRNRALRYSRPPGERPGSYRAGRLCALTPRTCSNDDSNKPACRLTIRPTPSVRRALRIFWKMTAPLKPLNESPARRQPDYETL